MLFSCDIILITAAGTEQDVVDPFEVIRHLTAAIAHALLNKFLAINLDKICEELIEFIGNGKEVSHRNNPDDLLFCIDNRESPYLMLHHHMGGIAYSFVRTHRNEWRTHDFFYMYSFLA